jgi:ubiquinone/menaquinone biosynthesis C-methylase UbiE
LNLAYYPQQVRRITTVDPNVGMHRLAQKRIEQMGFEIDHRVLSSEQLPFADNMFNCVVSTFTLCSIAGVEQAMGEVFRVLQPAGRFLFLEHGLSPEPSVQRWQRRLNRLEMWLGDGCHLDRDIKKLVDSQPFASVSLNESYVKDLPKTHGFLYRGLATK